jgi:hypothetical protein
MERGTEIPKGLTLVSGLSSERVAELLTQAGILYKLGWEEPRREGYFRSSCFVIDALEGIRSMEQAGMPESERERRKIELSLRLCDIIGFANHLRGYTKSYFAEYQIGGGFDFSVFNGRVMFKKGRLVERVRVSIE